MKLSSWYDYSQLVYVDMATDIIIGCPIHGYFKQNPHHHRMGVNCPYCSGHSLFNPKTKEEIKEYWIENGITGSEIWYKHCQDNNLHEQGYPSNPWRSFKISCNEWTEYVRGKKTIKSKEETKEYWLDNDITGSSVWTKHWRGSNLQEQGYPSAPWGTYKMTCNEWVKYVWGKKTTKSKEEIKEYWIKNKITGSTIWRKHWKDNNLQEQGYPSVPWGLYKMTCIEWTEYVWNKNK